ncbi:hypothetical protein EVAR_10201_1 [Eumeta japonica]|uniref:Uncharacterized protein n=1 Tax=Eumeta variegata TaxID=151549 RepID=A0A4C1TGI0_EUMVA|nr:hypothetical protein EVAR_10201_1 [Eumeta japonica]
MFSKLLTDYSKQKARKKEQWTRLNLHLSITRSNDFNGKVRYITRPNRTAADVSANSSSLSFRQSGVPCTTSSDSLRAGVLAFGRLSSPAGRGRAVLAFRNTARYTLRPRAVRRDRSFPTLAPAGDSPFLRRFMPTRFRFKFVRYFRRV